MSAEDHVSYYLKEYLRANGWLIVHYHPPGGQACNPIHLSSGRFIYLDILAFRTPRLLLVENKGAFCAADVTKLRTLLADARAGSDAEALLRREAIAQGWPSPPADIRLEAAHGYGGRQPVTTVAPGIHLCYVASDGKITAPTL